MKILRHSENLRRLPLESATALGKAKGCTQDIVPLGKPYVLPMFLLLA
jgi:hypothetical protein